jgi:hypothetical protein
MILVKIFLWRKISIKIAGIQVTREATPPLTLKKYPNIQRSIE